MKKIILLLIILTLSFSASAFEVEISKEAEVESPQITLAAISKINAADLSDQQLEELKELNLSRSAAPGYKKQLTRVLVDLSIKNLGYNKADYKLIMPKNILVSRKSSVIKAEEIKKLAEKYLLSKLDFPPEDILIKAGRKLKDINTAAGNYKLTIREGQSISLPDSNLAVEIIQNGEKIRTIYYPLKIKLKLNVYTAKKDLALNSALHRSDFKLQKIEISGNPEDFLKTWPDNLNNKKLARSLKKGEILTFNDLKTPDAVKWGDKLHLSYKMNNIIISTFVAARERGKIGDLITVENLNSGYRFKARIISSNEVVISSE